MNSPSPHPPSDSELDSLLASRLRRTSPEFEQRWRELRGQLASRGRTSRPAWLAWWLWPGAATAAVALAALFFILRPPVPHASAPVLASFEELVSLDAALAPAAPLLEPETREALLHLPVNSNP
jgi:hypothetical protein